MVRSPYFHCQGPGSVSHWGSEMHQAAVFVRGLSIRRYRPFPRPFSAWEPLMYLVSLCVAYSGLLCKGNYTIHGLLWHAAHVHLWCSMYQSEVLFIAKEYAIACIHCVFFIHSSISRYLIVFTFELLWMMLIGTFLYRVVVDTSLPFSGVYT